MTQYIDKDALIAEIERRIKNLYPKGGQGMVVTKILKDHYEDLISFIDSMQEEPVNKDFEMALAEMIDKAQTSVVEPLVVAAQWKDELIKLAKSEEPVSEEWIEELRTKLDSLSKEDFKKVFDKYAVDFNEEPVSEELEEAAFDYAEACKYDGGEKLLCVEHFKAGAQWQKHRDNIPSKDLEELINKLSCQFPEVSFAKLSRIAVRVSRWQRNQDTKNKLPEVINRTDLDEYSYQCAYDMSNDWMIENPTWHDVENACKLGAKWQKENLWKPADGDDLPEIDREVIVLINYNTQCNIHDEEYPTYRVGFGHRPNPDGWDGKNIDTNVITHYTPKLYDKGDWNAPNIVYWLDVELPKEIEL